MNGKLRAGNAVRTPAPTDTNRLAPASRPIAHASGAARAPLIANGTAAANAFIVPKTARNGTWTSDARGIQWAFEGIGRTGAAGILPPTSAKIHTKSTLNPCPVASDRATSA